MLDTFARTDDVEDDLQAADRRRRRRASPNHRLSACVPAACARLAA
jgi:hypothetical protein